MGAYTVIGKKTPKSDAVAKVTGGARGRSRRTVGSTRALDQFDIDARFAKRWDGRLTRVETLPGSGQPEKDGDLT
jgi:hypothetical protein